LAFGRVLELRVGFRSDCWSGSDAVVAYQGESFSRLSKTRGRRGLGLRGRHRPDGFGLDGLPPPVRGLPVLLRLPQSGQTIGQGTLQARALRVNAIEHFTQIAKGHAGDTGLKNAAR